MIKRITSNGIYWTILSFILTLVAYVNQPLIDNKTSEGELFMLFQIVSFVMILVLDIIVLKRKRFVYITITEMIISSILLIFYIVSLSTPISIYILLLISLSHYVYRIANYMEIEKLKLESKYEDIRKVLNLTKECIGVKGDLKNYTTYIRGKEISFDTEHSLMYKNKRIKFDILKQLQIDFNKTFINFDDDELKVAEMYSIQ